MKVQKLNRNTHQGKTWEDKISYGKYLTGRTYLGGTAPYPVDTAIVTGDTDESVFKEEEKQDIPKISKPRKPRKSSNKLLVIIRENPGATVATIIGALLVSVFMWIISGYFTMNRELGVHGAQINTLNGDVKTLRSKSDKNEDNYNNLKNEYDVLKTYVSDNIGSKENNKKK